ncbi:RNA polymerase sigma factor [Actinopolymorpha singaporensis]|uniref:RNA polymerase sigma factor, sigma-70 family n=1 Tax=Actinopolymorpha singaporensis TaxID=117157 RepID=A0A1H1T964_9ACTN|nr:sigma-70 family RNA polymerase sigma factor [Actinopolymorpha singaporensis]SDS56762.1 RNA polymerase sigma factor, sigma-70 family [Actinopolymorpha singaporensis]
MTATGFEDLWRECAPHVLAALVRRYGDFDTAEDAVQEALLAAARQWPTDGMPDNPRSWLIRVASRRLIDHWRADQARADREDLVARHTPAGAFVAPAADTPAVSERDDSLSLLLLCCHPALPRPSQVALTLRAVGGLGTAQIARAFLVPETTMAQRISRAKARLRQVGARFTVPAPEELPERVAAVAHVLYLIFTEGHTATTGPSLTDTSLAEEAIRLTRRLHGHLPGAGEVSGLLALMLLTEARRTARTRPDGSLVPLAEQDRSLWDQELIGEGVRLVESTLPTGPVGPYQLQAAIAAVHAEARTAAETDWPQIEALYGMLHSLTPGPVVTLNHAVAVAEVDGPAAALRMIEPLLADRRLRHHHRLHAVHAHLLELEGRYEEARTAYATAARLTTSIPEQRYLNARATDLPLGSATAVGHSGHDHDADGGEAHLESKLDPVDARGVANPQKAGDPRAEQRRDNSDGNRE